MQQTTWQEIQDIAKERDGVIYRLGYESAIGLKTTKLKMAKDNLSFVLNDKIKLLLSQQRKEIEEMRKLHYKYLSGDHREDVKLCKEEGCDHYELGADDFFQDSVYIITKLSREEV